MAPTVSLWVRHAGGSPIPEGNFVLGCADGLGPARAPTQPSTPERVPSHGTRSPFSRRSVASVPLPSRPSRSEAWAAAMEIGRASLCRARALPPPRSSSGNNAQARWH